MTVRADIEALVEGIDDATSREVTEYAAPRDEVEEELAKIWSRILRVERIGVHDDFLRLGGDSVLAMRIIAQAARDALLTRGGAG